MKKLALIFAATVSIAHAELTQHDTKVVCGTTLEIVRILVDKYGEQPILIGRSEALDADITVWLNPTTKSFTIIKSDATMACQLDAGVKLTPYKRAQ